MGRKIDFCLAVSEEYLGDGAPVLLQGGLENAFINASRLGFDSVEIHIREPYRYKPERILENAKNSNIRIAAIGTGLEYSMNGLSLTSPDKAVRDKMSGRLKEFIDLAACLGSVVFLGLCRGKVPDFKARAEYLDILEEELAPVAAYALKHGVLLGLEPIAFYLTNLLNTTSEALEFLKRPGLNTIQLLLDTHHMFIEDRDMSESFKLCAGRIAHIHISDSNRQYPGGGNIDYALVARALRQIGYDRAVSLEVLPYPSGEAAAVQGINWMQSIWG